jgi:SAM-dependent methyltransferase
VLFRRYEVQHYLNSYNALKNIDQEPSSFDVVFLVLGPMLMPDPNKVFQEIQRVLIPAGWSGYLTPGKMEIHDIMSQSRKEILDSCNRGDEFMHMYDSDMMKHWGTPDAVKARLEDAKFNAVESVLVQSSLDIQRGAQVDKTVSEC